MIQYSPVILYFDIIKLKTIQIRLQQSPFADEVPTRCTLLFVESNANSCI